MDSLLHAINSIVNNEDEPITIRHLFYRLVGQKELEKTESAYHLLCGHLSNWRRAGDVAWDAFADSTRWHRRTATFDSIENALENTVDCYRKNLWANQSAYVEIWSEKDAIAGILFREADTFGVPVFTCRGFPSLSSLYLAANTFKEAIAHGKKVFIYYCGDHDPSGLAIDKAIVAAFRDDFGVEVQFIRAAVTPEQIHQYDLPTRPVKKSDTRAGGWRGGCVEVDTLPPENLKGIVRDCIQRHIDPRQWEQAQATEAAEKATLREYAANFGDKK